MSSNGIQPWSHVPAVKTDFELKGIPGDYTKVVSVTSATTNFTGSNYGAAAVMLNATTTGTITLAGGGTINLADLSANIEYPFAPLTVVETGANIVYVLIK